jgi:2-polyprenyl-3-methyl-5-hydroxy-6-metoxy-1,4-benzoquinol methylase
MAEHVGSIPKGHIVSRYQDVYGVDVSEYYSDVPGAEVYECESTGYRFYYPFSLIGQEKLYRDLEGTVDGTYKDDKWEYQKALSYIKDGDRVLDVGCGKGFFVKLASDRGAIAHGLELNSESAAEAIQRGIGVVSTETIDSHARANPERYDVVCSFQVLEHIAGVTEFIENCLNTLRPGGLLIFGVPNNDGFVGVDGNAVLNMPPHHMGLWGEKSLRSLTKLFRLKLRSIELEPLSEYGWYAAVTEQQKIPRSLLPLYYRFGIHLLFKKWIELRAHRIPGHTIIAIFEKQ